MTGQWSDMDHIMIGGMLHTPRDHATTCYHTASLDGDVALSASSLMIGEPDEEAGEARGRPCVSQ